MKHDLEFDIDDNGHQGAQFCCPHCLVYVWGKVVMVPEARWGTLGLSCSECLEIMIAWDGNDNLVEIPAPKVEHSKDSDCTLDATDVCTVCHVGHAEPCVECGGRGYHKADCAEIAA